MVVDAYRQLARAQKGHARGAPAYSVYVNRRLGRVLAAVAFRLGLTPNQVSIISAVHSFAAIALIAFAPVTVPLGLLIALLLVLGYAWDSADGQVARLRGGGSPQGEWLDHFIDTLKIWGPNYFSSSGLVSANQFAAMPSMHIGWSTIGALTVATCLPRIKGFPIGWVIGGFHVTMMTLTVMATGNHYFLDEVGGWLVVAVALVLAWFLTDRFPFKLPKWFSPT